MNLAYEDYVALIALWERRVQETRASMRRAALEDATHETRLHLRAVLRSSRARVEDLRDACQMRHGRVPTPIWGER